MVDPNDVYRLSNLNSVNMWVKTTYNIKPQSLLVRPDRGSNFFLSS